MNDNRMTFNELRATWGLGSVFSLRMLGMFMVLPVLTTYGMALQGANESLIGLAIGIYGFTQAILQIPIGLLSDKLGRKPIITLGLLIFILGSIIAANSQSIWGIIIGRALQGAGAIASAVMALLSDLTREQNRTKAMAFIGISFGITFAIALVLGPILTHHLGLHSLFWLIAILACIAILVTWLIVPNSQHHLLNRESAIVQGALRKVLTNRNLMKLNISILLLQFILMANFVVLPKAMIDADFTAANHWKVYLITMILAFILSLPAIIIAEVKHKMKSIFIVSIVLMLFAEAIFFHSSQQLIALFIGIQLFFIAFNIMEALLPSLISKEAPAGYKGTAMGIYSTSQFIGVALGGSLAGWLFQHYSLVDVFILNTLLVTIWLFISFSFKEPLYLSNLRLTLPEPLLKVNSILLNQQLKQQAGVVDSLVSLEEQSAYVKIDKKMTNRDDLETYLQELAHSAVPHHSVTDEN